MSLQISPLAPRTEQIRAYLFAALAPATRRAYQSDWNHFSRWCGERELPVLPALPETVAAYLGTLAQEGKTTATLERRVAALSQVHQAAGFHSPTQELLVRKVFAGIRRIHGLPPKSKQALPISLLRRAVFTLPESLRGSRDRALLLVGFAGAFRRSELVGLRVEDLTFTDAGVLVKLRRSKTDPEGEGREVGLPYGRQSETCPVRALRNWLAAAGIEQGWIFRRLDPNTRRILDQPLSGYWVARTVQAAVSAAGGDPTLYAGHSLRSGLATAAAEHGASERSIMEQTGHKSLQQVRRYIRRGTVFQDNAAAQAGL